MRTFLEKLSSVLFDAFWGKLSILCFVAVIVGVTLYGLFNPDDGFGMALIACYLLMLCVPLGYLFGILSVVQKEVPKRYRYIGFFLNSLWLLLLGYMLLGGSM